MVLFRPGGLALTEKAAEHIGLRPGMAFLDIGCGLGTSLEFLGEKYSLLAHGVELSPRLAERAQACCPGAVIVQADAMALPYGDESFDAVSMECVLTLVKDPFRALSEAKRVLKIGGSLFLSVLWAKEGCDALCQEGRVDQKKLINALEALGFELTLNSDETPALRSFVAEILFTYDSIEDYIQKANDELDGCVLDCALPGKGTGYLLIAARRIK